MLNQGILKYSLVERLECGHALCLQGCTHHRNRMAHTLFTGQREGEKEKEREKESGGRRNRERGETEKEIVLTCALAPFSYLV
jgi:hypothetical protein